jgi:hypothetical protein
MIIFPFGFFILDEKAPVYVGNDLRAQTIVRAWLEANPDKVRLAFDAVGPARVLTRFLGWDESPRSSSMDPEPMLFESSSDGIPEIAERRLYRNYHAALAGHAELVEIAKARLRGEC